MKEAMKLRDAAEKVVELCSERPLSLGKWFIDMSEACESLREALVKPCCGNFTQCHEVCMPRAAALEREACAKVCEQKDDEGECPDQWDWHSSDYAAAIRARSNT